MFIYGRKVYCCNVGDSRTVIIRKADTEDKCKADALSKDHKPDDPKEAAHIIANRGRIDCFRDVFGHQVGPLRVWLKGEDIPGLAMTRSFGDSVAARVGVNAIPDIKAITLQPDD